MLLHSSLLNINCLFYISLRRLGDRRFTGNMAIDSAADER